MLHNNLTARALDDVLAGSFPASDPPAWMPGLARPPRKTARRASTTAARRSRHATRPDGSGTIDVSTAAAWPRTFPQAVASLLGATGLMLVVPLVILAAGTPLALAVRGVLEIAGRLLAFIR